MLLGIRWGNLRAKIIAWAFVPAAIILAAIALVIYIAYQQVTQDLVIERNRELTRLSASQLTAELKEYADLLTAEARRPELTQNESMVQRRALQEAGNRLAVFDGGVLLLDTFGTVVATEPERAEIMGQNWSDRLYYRQVIRSELMDSPAPAFSDILWDGPEGAPAVAVAVPIQGSRGELTGILVGLFRVGATSVSALYGDITRLRLGESDGAYIVDGNGRLIYHFDEQRLTDDISDQHVVQQVLAQQTDALRAEDMDGQEIVASFAPVPGTSWGLVIQERWSELIGASQPYRRFLLLLLALGVTVPALVVAAGSRRLTRPIAQLSRAAREVAGGNFGQTISAPTGDEIEDLADQFNRMSAQLQESYTNLEQRVADRTRELAALNAIASVVSQSLDLDEILNGALDMTVQMLEIEAGGIYLLDEATGMLTIAAQRGFKPAFLEGIDCLKAGEGLSGRVVQSGEHMVVNDTSADPRLTRMVVREEGLHSQAIVPLRAKGKVLGTLFAVSRRYREFTDQEVQLLSSIGHQIGVAVESARLFQAEQRLAEQFRVISEVGRHIASILEINEVLVQVVRLIRKSFNYEHVAIALIEGEEAVYKVGAGTLWDAPGFQFHPYRLRVGEEGITGWVAATGQPLLVPDVGKEPRYVAMRGAETRSEMAVPIIVKGQVVGVLDVQSDHLNAFQESDLIVLQSLANQAAVAIDNARLYEQAQKVAVVEERQRLARELHDAVTQTLFSASLIAEALPDLWSIDEQEGRQLLQELRQLSRGALAEMRTLLLELRPAALVEASLDELMHQLGEAFTGRMGVPVRVVVDGQCNLPPDIHVALYRIAQEALNNVVKHAMASQVEVHLSQALLPISDTMEQRVMATLQVSDNGRGFDPTSVPPNRLGLGIIRERAAAIGAQLTIETRSGHGTQVTVVWSDTGQAANHG